jgi:hypothetical protein
MGHGRQILYLIRRFRGIDMALAFVSDLKGEEKAVQISNHIEYIRNTDASFDPFARNFIK